MTPVLVTHPRYVEHDLTNYSHPEHSGRIEAVWALLEATGLMKRMRLVTPEPLDEKWLLEVHDVQLLDLMRLISEQPDPILIDSDTYALPTSYEVARLAAGGVVQAVDEVASGRADSGLAIVRPPGHHATPARAMGFCLLSNVAIAARFAQKAHNLRRVMIVDIDVHHGNGTQDTFYADPDVLFVSIHQSRIFPGTGNIQETGRGEGEGFTINIPLSGKHGDENYLRLYKTIIQAAARRFQPEFMLVSIGFDAHWADPLASMKLSLTGYALICRELKQLAEDLCNGKIVFVMEGGYDLKALSHGISNVARVLLDDPEISDPYGTAKGIEPDVEGIIAELRRIHTL